MKEGCLVPISLQKAFDSVAHNYATAFFELMCLPPDSFDYCFCFSLLKLSLLCMGYPSDSVLSTLPQGYSKDALSVNFCHAGFTAGA